MNNTEETLSTGSLYLHQLCQSQTIAGLESRAVKNKFLRCTLAHHQWALCGGQALHGLKPGHGRSGQGLGSDGVVATLNSHPMGFAKDILAV